MKNLLQIQSIMTTEMCDATVSKVRFDRVQFIRSTSILFGLPDFEINST